LQSYDKQKVANPDVIQKPVKIQKMALQLEENIMVNHSLQKEIKESNRNDELSLNAQPDKAGNKNNNGKEIKKPRNKYWFIKITSELTKLNKVGEGFLNHNKIEKVQGQYSPNIEKDLCPHLQMIVKFYKQTQETSIVKVVSEFIKYEEILSSNFTPLPYPKDQEQKVKEIKASMMLEDTEELTKGVWKVEVSSRKKEEEKLAEELILEKGMAKAEEEWAEQDLDLDFFKKVKKNVMRKIYLKKRSDRRKQAERDAKMFYPWQKYLAEQLEKTPDNRTVWCVLDEKGCNGKSHFQRVIMDLYDEDVLIMTSDKTRNMTYLASQKSEYKILIINVARQCKTVNLKALEEIKDGVVTSTKYRAKIRRNDPPHMVLLSNTPLDWNGLSSDRWKILYIKPGQDPANKDAFEIFTLSEYLSYVLEKKKSPD
jgi:hypothetical protein